MENHYMAFQRQQRRRRKPFQRQQTIIGFFIFGLPYASCRRFLSQKLFFTSQNSSLASRATSRDFHPTSFSPETNAWRQRTRQRRSSMWYRCKATTLLITRREWWWVALRWKVETTNWWHRWADSTQRRVCCHSSSLSSSS